MPIRSLTHIPILKSYFDTLRLTRIKIRSDDCKSRFLFFNHSSNFRGIIMYCYLDMEIYIVQYITIISSVFLDHIYTWPFPADGGVNSDYTEYLRPHRLEMVKYRYGVYATMHRCYTIKPDFVIECMIPKTLHLFNYSIVITITIGTKKLLSLLFCTPLFIYYHLHLWIWGLVTFFELVKDVNIIL